MNELKGREKQIVGERRKKVEALRAEGINPYPQEFSKKSSCTSLQEKYKEISNEEKVEELVSTAGRLMLKRVMGKIAFGTLEDERGSIQVLIQKDECPPEVMSLFKKIDAGDFIGVTGNPMRTKRGELSILAKELVLLSKSIKPLPEKWHGIQDKEERYRKRYLDLIMNKEVRETFRFRSEIIKTLRSFLDNEGFIELEIPAIQSVYGGASAQPFVTHINALDMDAYLSISPELYLKRLIVGGYERVYTICKNFRNEGIDYSHNPEFTMLEYYAAYKDYTYHIDLIQRFFEELRKNLNISETITYRGNEISLKTPFPQKTFRDLLQESLGIDINEANTFEKFKAAIVDKKLEVDVSDCKHYGSLLDEVYKRLVRPRIIQPLLLTHYPVEMIALAKRNASDPTKINSVQLIIDGAEIVKAYDELNDPLDQEERFLEQDKLKSEGDDEAMPHDADFVNALMHGMPPTAGLGLGIDRLVMILTGKDSIRDVILFPFMKQEESKKEKKSSEKKKETKKEKLKK